MKKYLVSKELSVKKAIEHMEEGQVKAVVVLDANDCVVGLFSNGDMRSYFLRGGSLAANICEAMNPNPVLYRSKEEINEERKKVRRILYPIVDENKHIVEIVDYERQSEGMAFSDVLRDVPLVIMAGGKGTRLYPYTKILPKPLIPIGDLTITERIIGEFRKYGGQDVIMVLNYRANMIRAYMGELSKDYKIDFVQEQKFLGTGGGLRLLKDKLKSTFLLSNCDILVNADMECIYKTHKANGNKITFVCSMKNFVIPYGVIETNEDGTISQMREKPEFSFMINTGLYIIEPEVLDIIEEDEVIGLPDVAKRCMERGEKVGVFPISENAWLDMGQFSEMENMIKKLGL